MSDTTRIGQAGPAGPRPGEHPQQRALSTPGVQRLSHEPLRQVKTLDSLFANAEFRQRIAESVPKHVTPDRMLRTMVTAVQKAPLLVKADLRGLIGAFLTCSQCGLEPNTPMQHMHLIPFKRTKWNPDTRQREDAGVEVQIIFGYPGLLELSYRSPLVTSISANVVFAGDDFSFEYGTDAHLRHRPKGGSAAAGLRPTHAYMMAKLKDGFAFEVMPWADVLAVRNNSQAYRQALFFKEDAESKGRRLPPGWTEAPWVKHEIPMGRKTAFRAGSKWLPRSVEMASVIAIDEAQERRRNIDWGTVIDASDGDYVSAAVVAAEAPAEDDGGDYYGAAAGVPTDQQQEEPRREAPKPQEQRQEPRQEPRVDPPATGAVFGGTSFGDGGRDAGDPGPTDDRAPPPPQDERAAPPKPRATRAKPPELPEFSAVVMDQYGDPADGAIHAARLEWAHAYATAWEGCDSEAMTEALAEHNAEAITDASQDRKAASVIAGLALPTARMRHARATAEADAKAKAEAERQAAEIKARAAEQAEADRVAAEAAGTSEPEPAPEPEAAEDPDAVWAAALCVDAEKATLADVNAMIAHKGIQNRMKDFQKARPDLFRMVETAFQKRLARKG